MGASAFVTLLLISVAAGVPAGKSIKLPAIDDATDLSAESSEIVPVVMAGHTPPWQIQRHQEPQPAPSSVDIVTAAVAAPPPRRQSHGYLEPQPAASTAEVVPAAVAAPPPRRQSQGYLEPQPAAFTAEVLPAAVAAPSPRRRDQGYLEPQSAASTAEVVPAAVAAPSPRRRDQGYLEPQPAVSTAEVVPAAVAAPSTRRRDQGYLEPQPAASTAEIVPVAVAAAWRQGQGHQKQQPETSVAVSASRWQSQGYQEPQPAASVAAPTPRWQNQGHQEQQFAASVAAPEPQWQNQGHQEPQSAASTAVQTDHSIELVGGSQTFFPSFANLFEPRQQSSYRIGFGNQETAFSQKPQSYRSLLNYPLFGNYRSLDGFGKQNNAASAPLVDAASSVLGSGNFGIIRGGTFFAQNDEDSDDFHDSFSAFYNNGHGRPSLGSGYIANPRPNFNQEQFANFRDFADINSPSNSAYSHYVVVYANKNATMDEVSEETRRVTTVPKNIIETLERLDDPKPPKITKTKSKLAATKQKFNKKEQWKKANSKYISPKHELEEPLLALS